MNTFLRCTKNEVAWLPVRDYKVPRAPHSAPCTTEASERTRKSASSSCLIESCYSSSYPNCDSRRRELVGCSDRGPASGRTGNANRAPEQLVRGCLSRSLQTVCGSKIHSQGVSYDKKGVVAVVNLTPYDGCLEMICQSSLSRGGPRTVSGLLIKLFINNMHLLSGWYRTASAQRPWKLGLPNGWWHRSCWKKLAFNVLPSTPTNQHIPITTSIWREREREIYIYIHICNRQCIYI